MSDMNWYENANDMNGNENDMEIFGMWTFMQEDFSAQGHFGTGMFRYRDREYFYSVIFEISDKQMQFAELKNTPKPKKNWYFDNFDKSKSRNTASGSWFGQKYGL